jgi:hypothetical protein
MAIILRSSVMSRFFATLFSLASLCVAFGFHYPAWMRSQHHTNIHLLLQQGNHVKLGGAVVDYSPIDTQESKDNDVKESERFKYVKRLLLTYKGIYGDMLVPQSFIVPYNDSLWPTHASGIKLGSLVHNLRSKLQKSDHRKQELLSLGFCFNTRRLPYKVLKRALLCYRDHTGNMNVPNDFVVPANIPGWPAELCGLQLGYLLTSIRDGAYRVHRKDLLSIGYPPEAKSSLKGFDRFRAALLEYERNLGNMLVPSQFVIPEDSKWSQQLWGMKLGSYVSNVRASVLYVDRMDDLKELGFTYEARVMSFTFETLKAALYEFQDIEGDMLVPINFVVPLNGSRNSINGTSNSGVWPEDTRGIRLGRTVTMIRYNRSYVEHRNELERIGFSFTPRPKGNYGDFEFTKSMLIEFKDKFGHLQVDSKYVVPRDVPEWPSEWPESMQGNKLGRTVSHIKNGKLFGDRKADLIEIGFDYDHGSDRSSNYERTKSALMRFKQLYGDLNVPSTYIVPEKKEWSSSLWSCQLGQLVDSIRGGFAHVSQRNDLSAVGLDYDSQNLYEYDTTRKVLLEYKAIYGNMLIEKDYLIPSGNSMWPEEMWGLKLGQCAANIRKGYSFKTKKEELQSLGFNYARRETCNYDQFRSALLHFKGLYGDMNVPKKYVLPTSNVNQCEDMCSLNLGCVVSRVRSGQKFNEHSKDLELLGFDFNTQIKHSYELTRRMLVQYKALYGHLSICRGFIIPSDSADWPEEMHGQKLGGVVCTIQRGSYSDKRDDLLSIGFVFSSRKRKFDYECVKIALFKYRELFHGSTAVPYLFKIEEGSSWYPKETWGMPLGTLISRIRNGTKWPEKRSALLG